MLTHRFACWFAGETAVRSGSDEATRDESGISRDQGLREEARLQVEPNPSPFLHPKDRPCLAAHFSTAAKEKQMPGPRFALHSGPLDLSGGPILDVFASGGASPSFCCHNCTVNSAASLLFMNGEREDPFLCLTPCIPILAAISSSHCVYEKGDE